MRRLKKKIYLDYAATTPLDPRVFEAMLPYWGVSVSDQLTNQPMNQLTTFGNPGSLHSYGQEASAAVFKARQTIAEGIGAHYSEIIFTGSATEANNLALRGALAGWINMSYEARSMKYGGAKSLIHNSNLILHPRIIISAIEHESILETAKMLEQEGAEVVRIPVSKEGVIDLKKLKAALNERTVLVSVMYGNNEVGTIQPIRKIAEIINNFRRSLPINQLTSQPVNYPLLHTDAVQAFQYLPCRVNELGVDLMTLSAHKIYGPKGVGCLYIRRRSDSKLQPNTYNLSPLTTGGGQEFAMRSGTENVPGIIGFAKAVELIEASREKEAVRIMALRDLLYKRIKNIFPRVVIHGSWSDLSGSAGRLPNNLNIYIPHASGEQLLVALDLAGVAVSSGSACKARSIDPSTTLLAMGVDRMRAKNSLRFTLGRMSARADVLAAARVLALIKKSLSL